MSEIVKLLDQDECLALLESRGVKPDPGGDIIAQLEAVEKGLPIPTASGTKPASPVVIGDPFKRIAETEIECERLLGSPWMKGVERPKKPRTDYQNPTATLANLGDYLEQLQNIERGAWERYKANKAPVKDESRQQTDNPSMKNPSLQIKQVELIDLTGTIQKVAVAIEHKPTATERCHQAAASRRAREEAERKIASAILNKLAKGEITATQACLEMNKRK